MPPSLPRHLITAVSTALSVFVVTAVAVHAIEAPQWGSQPTDNVNSEVEEVEEIVPIQQDDRTIEPVHIARDFIASINFIAMASVQCEGKQTYNGLIGILGRDLVVLIHAKSFDNRNDECYVVSNGRSFETGRFLHRDDKANLFLLKGSTDNRDMTMTVGRFVAQRAPRETSASTVINRPYIQPYRPTSTYPSVRSNVETEEERKERLEREERRKLERELEYERNWRGLLDKLSPHPDKESVWYKDDMKKRNDARARVRCLTTYGTEKTAVAECLKRRNLKPLYQHLQKDYCSAC